MKKAPEYISPWGLTQGQADVMDVVVATGSIKIAATRLGLSRHTVADHIRTVHRKMRQSQTMRAAVLWDRWRRPSGALLVVEEASHGSPMPA